MKEKYTPIEKIRNNQLKVKLKAWEEQTELPIKSWENQYYRGLEVAENSLSYEQHYAQRSKTNPRKGIAADYGLAPTSEFKKYTPLRGEEPISKSTNFLPRVIY